MKSTKILSMLETSHMAKEISSQPKLWKETYETVLTRKDGITHFLDEIYKINNLKIIHTGEGTSAFIGEIIQHAFHKNTGIPIKAIATTDLVTHPRDFFQKSIPTL